jgi:hypothetical protein
MKRFDVKNLDGRIDLQVEIHDLQAPPKITKRMSDDQVVVLEIDAQEVHGRGVVLFGLVEVREQVARAGSPPATPDGPKLCVHCGRIVAAAGVEQPDGRIAHRSCAANPTAAAATKGGRDAHSR